MKYLAILKDCLQEALDSKVLYVMVGISILTVILVGSISYYPATIEHGLDRGLMFGRSSSLGMNNVTVLWQYDKIDNFKVTDDGVEVPKHRQKEPWKYDYSFDVVYRASVEVQGDATPEQKAQVLEQSRQSFATPGLADEVKHSFQWRQPLNQLKNLKAELLSSNDAESIRVRVSSHGTRAASSINWPHYLKILYFIPVTEDFQMPLSAWLWIIEDFLVCGMGAGAALVLSTIMTAFFIPNMLRKGTVDLLIVKPINRITLLIYKYIGGLSYMFINTVIIIFGMWLVLGLRSGVWGTGFLLSIPILSFEFAIFYAVSTLFGVLTRSTIVAILMGVGAWAVVAVLGYAYVQIDKTRHLNEQQAVMSKIFGEGRDEDVKDSNRPEREDVLPKTVYVVADTIHFVIP